MASEIKVNTIKDLGGNTIVSSNGSGTITGLPASAISSGTVATARLGSGTASSSTFLAGDSSYKTVSAGVSLSGSTNNTVATVTGANALIGEADLTFDGDSLLVKNGASGGSGANANANELVVENSDHGGISILTPYDKTGAIYFGDGSDDNIGMIEYPHDANCLKFTTNASERMRITSGGIVGVGANGSSADLGNGLHVKVADSGASVNANRSAIVVENTGDNGMTIASNNAGQGGLWFANQSQTDAGQINYNHPDDSMRFYTAGDEALRIYNNHSFLFNYGNNNNGAVTMYVHGQLNNTAMAVRHGTSSGTDETLIAFTDGADQASGSIKINPNANTVSYNTSSDYRLKENVNYKFDATTELKKLKPAKFNWKTNPSLTVDGFIAHEVSDVVPLAVQGNKDETEVILNGVYNANGNLQRKDVSEDEWTKGKANGVFANDTTWSESKTIPKYQSIDQAKLVPLLVKTIQELEARITTLENA